MNAKMPELKRCFEHAGFTDVKTVLSSGNVIFSASRGASEAALERRIETAMKDCLDRVFYSIVRPVDRLQEILDADPFSQFKLKPGSKRVVTLLRQKPKVRLALPISKSGAAILKLDGRELYSAYVPGPEGPVFMQLIEKTLGKDVTTRTWDTLRKVAILK